MYIHHDSSPNSFFLPICRLTREDFACAASDGHQVLDQVLAVGGLAAARLPQQHDGLILPCGEQAAVSRLGHRVDMRSRVLTSTALEHVHYLIGEEDRDLRGQREQRSTKQSGVKIRASGMKKVYHNAANLRPYLHKK